MKFFIAFSTLVSCLSVLAAPVEQLQGRAALELVQVRFPNYLVPIKENSPDQAIATRTTGYIRYDPNSQGNEVRMLVGFDVPANVGTWCAIDFRIAPRTPGGYPWRVTGSGKLDVWSLQSTIQNGQTNWNNKPGRTTEDPQFTIAQSPDGGNAEMKGDVIECKGGQRMDFEVAVTRPTTTETLFDWFELTEPWTGITLFMYA